MIRGGDLLRTEVFTGRADGRYRLGGLDNLHPEISLFFVLATGDGVEWIDNRARGGDGRGYDGEAVLIARGDMLTWPASIVSTGDRDVTGLLLNRDGLVLFGPTDIDSAAGLAAKASDGAEFGWPLNGFAKRKGDLLCVGDDALWRLDADAPDNRLPAGLTSAQALASHDGDFVLPGF